jgi:hypothetical protein
MFCFTWGTNRFTSIPVRHDPRRLGSSNYSFGKLVIHGLNMLTGFSTLPLQLASITGFAFMFFGIGVLAYVLGRYAILGYSVPGFPFLASIIAIFSGAQLFALGIIGEYLAPMIETPLLPCHLPASRRIGWKCRRSLPGSCRFSADRKGSRPGPLAGGSLAGGGCYFR